MFSDSPDQIRASGCIISWYDSPSNDLTQSGHRQYTQRIPLRTQHKIKKEATEEVDESKIVDFNLSAEDDDDEDSDSLFARSLMKPLSIDKTSPDLIWRKQKSEDNTQATKILSSLPQNLNTEECLNLSRTLPSKPSTSKSDIISSSSLMTTPVSNRKRPAQYEMIPNESPLATSTPIGANKMVKKPKLSNVVTPPRITKFDDSFNDDAMDDIVFDNFKIKHPEMAKKAESRASSQIGNSQLPDFLSTPKINRSRVKPSTPFMQKSKSMVAPSSSASSSSMLPSLAPAVPPKQTIPTKNSNTPMRKAKSFANDDDDDFYDDSIFM
jgi:hypothetical protein